MTDDRLQDRLRIQSGFEHGCSHELLWEAADRIDELERRTVQAKALPSPWGRDCGAPNRMCPTVDSCVAGGSYQFFAPDRDQGTGALGLLVDTATLKTVEAVEGRVYRWDGVRGWIVVTDEVAVEAAAQALRAWPLVSVDDRRHGTATHMATDALAAPWRRGREQITEATP